MLRRVGGIELADLAAICELQGLEHLPHPFFTGAWLPRGDTSGTTVDQRFADGDLHVFQCWMDAYRSADIWVESVVHFASRETPVMRILAHRTGESGFFSSQRPGEGVVDIFTLSPYELGAAVAASVGLTTPGKNARIVVPGFLPNRDHDAADRKLGRRGQTEAVVVEDDVTAFGVIQSHCQPAREWGLDWGRKYVAWVRVRDDGEYIYSLDSSHAAPVTPAVLGVRIDQLIAGEVAVLRERRGMT